MTTIEKTTKTFRLDHPEAQVYLVAQMGNDKPLVIEMRRVMDQWYARIELAPGSYRFRYYAGDHRAITYLRPAHTSGTVEDGLDGHLDVEAKTSPSTADLLAAHGCADALPAMSIYE